MSIILVISRPRQDNATSETLVSPNRIPIAMQLPVEKLLRGLKTRARTHVAMDHALLADADTKRCRLISISPIPGHLILGDASLKEKNFPFPIFIAPLIIGQTRRMIISSRQLPTMKRQKATQL